MANYPTFELVENEKDHLRRIYSTKLWDVSEMPSKLYMRNKDGSLVAISLAKESIRNLYPNAEFKLNAVSERVR